MALELDVFVGGGGGAGRITLANLRSRNVSSEFSLSHLVL